MKKMKLVSMLTLVFVVSAVIMGGIAFADEKELVIGSKEFTEQRILGNMMVQLLNANGFKAVDKTGLGGTLVARKALENGQIDIYMEYTGTGLITILKNKTPITDPRKCYEEVKKQDLEKNDLVWLPYMSFNNTYCLMMRQDEAKEKGIKSLSDLAAYVNDHPKKIKFGLNAEFYARPDGYRPLQKKYGFKFASGNIIKMQSGLLYKALKDSQISVGLGFATDGRIKGFDLVVLEDDQKYFPVYNPAPVVQKKNADKYPELVDIFTKLGKVLSTEEMTNLNYQVDIEHKTVRDAVAAWLKANGLI